jgi:AAA+ ATPase superfamily predicted ATPase
MKRTQITLTAEQRQELEKFSKTGVHSVRLVNRAKVILALDTSAGRKTATQSEIAEHIGLSRNAVYEIKRDFLKAKNVSSFLQRKKRMTPPVAPKITGEVEAKIVALACSAVPKGCARWTLQLLADKSVELNYIDSITDMSIHRLLKKHILNLT